MPGNSLRQIKVLLVLLSLLAAGPEQSVQDKMKKQIFPAFKYPISKLIIPTLEPMSRKISKDVRDKLYRYASEFSTILIKHLTGETEVHIEKGSLTEDSHHTLKRLELDMAVLQYSRNLQIILNDWCKQLLGQPVYPEIHNFLFEIAEDIFKSFEAFIYELQNHVNKDMRARNQQLCLQACQRKTKILNLSEAKVSPELDNLFKNGPNSVPSDIHTSSELKNLVEKDLITAAIHFSWDENKVYPLVNQSTGLKSVLEQLLAQAPSNSSQVDFFTTMYEKYEQQMSKFYAQLADSHFIDSTKVQNVIPAGTILSASDKGLGPVLLPIDWYVGQYKEQSVKGKHIVTNMSVDQCIHALKKEIEHFRSNLATDERTVLKEYFSNSSPDFRVGVLKLIPKIHKLSSFDNQAWKKLPSRPIRGAENCPVNPYSKALCKMLQEMHTTLRALLPMQGTSFPLIYGCDEYSDNIQQVVFDHSTWSRKTLISGDFSDAYTKSSLHDLQNSIAKLGPVANWPGHKISLAQKLAKLVFENCYFETPSGILRQSQGFPMGGHSSREGLDNILLSREVDLLSDPISKDLLFYYRLVDDISLALDGDFSKVIALLRKMAEVYPHEMPLNIQISFGYSHFLDSHVYNFLQSTSSNGFTTSLAYKPLSKFDYVPFSSNISPLYKGRLLKSVSIIMLIKVFF